MSELKPCPFCGGKARTYRYQYGEKTGRLVTKYGVECVLCRAELPIRLCSEQIEHTIAAWNRRVHDESTND